MKTWLSRFDTEHFYNVLTQLLVAQTTQLPSEVEEYALIKMLEKKSIFDGLEGFPLGLSLFAKHFLTRHGVYFLLPALRAKNIGVNFELMRLRFYFMDVEVDPKIQALNLHKDTLLADFYGDLSVLENATETTVQALLIDFWQSFSAYQQADDALAILGLPHDAQWPAMQLAYRRLVAQHHPDKGGDAGRFIDIQQAYEALRLLHAPQ